MTVNAQTLREKNERRELTLSGLHRQNGPRVSYGSVDDEPQSITEQTDVHDAGVTEATNEEVDDEIRDELEDADHHITDAHHQLSSTCNRQCGRG